ncbi:hypothetical protein [Stenotrophomonas maltophilia]|uniref:hypothetical protein n=1 Tax=Stenotrophomonas maltophilia TaxID=40324 RepID=UPI0013DCD5B2|nr:hypothetical protein [Stenotrophomonas maltophilia]
MSELQHPLPTTTFLPLQRKSLARYVAHGTPPQTAVEQAGLMAAQLCRTRLHPAAEIERLLHDACALFAGNEGAAAQLAGPGGGGQPELDAWLTALAAHGVLLAPAEILQDVIAQSPREYPGLALQQACQETLVEHEIRFPATFSSDDDEATQDDVAAADARSVEHHGLYTSEQARVLRAIAANPDELIDLDGYAGTGKGHLVLALMEARPGRYTYVAPSRGQVEAFRARVPASTAVRLLTQIEFANRVAQHAARSGQTGGFVASYRRSTHTPREIAGRIGLQGIGGRSPEQVLLTAFEAINRWCASSAPGLAFQHFDRSVPAAMLDVSPYMAAAEHVWRCMFDAELQRGTLLSLSPAHIGKWLALRGVTPPQDMGMLLVDEAHDLSPSWKQLLATHAPGVVSLGDPHQCLTGTVPRWAASKVLEMHQSVRQGNQVEGLVNQTLALDGLGQDSGPFVGATDRATGVLHYRDWAQVPSEGLRIHGSVADLALDVAQLHALGLRPYLHPASLRALRSVLQRPLDAWRRRRDSASDQEWERFLATQADEGQGALVELFASADRVQSLLLALDDQDTPAEGRVALCLAEHAKNLQFDVVSLSPGCFSAGQGGRIWHNPVRAVYLALTRARRQLHVPGDGMEQLQHTATLQEQARQMRRRERQQASGYRPAR